MSLSARIAYATAGTLMRLTVDTIRLCSRSFPQRFPRRRLVKCWFIDLAVPLASFYACRLYPTGQDDMLPTQTAILASMALPAGVIAATVIRWHFSIVYLVIEWRIGDHNGFKRRHSSLWR